MTDILRGHFSLGAKFSPGTKSAGLAVALGLVAVLAASPARADRCDDLASQL